MLINQYTLQLARAAAELEEILPRLKDACERVNKNPKDRKALDELEEIITRGQFPLEVIGALFFTKLNLRSAFSVT